VGDDHSERAIAQQIEKLWSEAVARVWLGDVEFRRRLLADPKGTLRAMGAQLPDAATIKIVENKNNEVTFVLPLKPRSLGQLDAADVIEMYGTCPCTACSTGIKA
jgi:hypothetical protein